MFGTLQPPFTYGVMCPGQGGRRGCRGGVGGLGRGPPAGGSPEPLTSGMLHSIEGRQVENNKIIE